MSIKSKLNRLKPHLSTDRTEKEKFQSSHHEEIPYREFWVKEGVSPYYFDGDYCLVREKEFPIDQKHGIYSFSQFSDAVEAWNSSNVDHPLSAAGYKPESFFFFDTETTGLGGGVGNTIFILGHASLIDNKVKLKQHILPHPGAEIPLYKSFLDSVDYRTMATYNGKSFDWPQVKTRHTLIKEHVPKLPPFGHFDLYHASRRMWKHKLDRMKLSIVEKEVLGVERKDDLPGYLAPMIYFDFVERKDPQGMIGILKHNEIDILSLISLYTHLSFQILRLDKKQTSREIYEVGRWFSHLGDSDSAKEVFSHISQGNNLDSLHAKHALAYEYKKQKKWPEAEELWMAIADAGNNKIMLEACIELAKIYEHREKNYRKALIYTEKAKSISHTVENKKSPFSEEDLNKRLARLLKK
ncbi:ribonuclease H-like domain-containing protein [Cytobacillus dafuensis]|uniref:YprB ribonuclease H-like domain-containing protein n=1 Tax=Cytobacillus dafuensis TaxID=1742359 RepID=A0A5B8Z621_CYTDA|nr:ribonuclease H-like domain-containing protein [Cytobacillus dafuensis]QED48388.1 hypothetical protein FSZ17_14705 [Cytobacillus dafuensis]